MICDSPSNMALQELRDPEKEGETSKKNQDEKVKGPGFANYWVRLCLSGLFKD